MPLPRILGLATAVPPFRLAQEAVTALAERLFGEAFEDLARLLPVYANAAVKTRYSCVPLEWYAEEHAFGERNRLYVENAVKLLEQAAGSALAQASLAPAAVDSLVVVSSTGVATPSLDARLMERLPFRRDVERLPIFGLGCAGGVLGLSRAAALARSRPGSILLLLVVELCGLTFRPRDQSKSNFIATALFGDGAAAALISTRGPGPGLRAWGEHTWPNSLDVMGWRIEDDGFGVLFSRDIPALIRAHMADVTASYLDKHGLTLKDIDSFVCHPGGAKVIAALEEIFRLPPGGLVHSRDVLRDFGNMSAASLFFVLERALACGQGRRHLLSALGPGFTAGFATLEAA
jgi:alkylresorcinol/alkylpyrone synthase